jgi:hypothetical protein
MDRIEVQRRLFAAFQTLAKHGWTQTQCNRLVDGLYRDDAVEAAEKAAADNAMANPQGRLDALAQK